MPVTIIIIIQLETVAAPLYTPFEKSKRLEGRAERRKTIIVYKM